MTPVANIVPAVLGITPLDRGWHDSRLNGHRQVGPVQQWRSTVEKLITIKEAAYTLAVSPEFLKKLQRAGRLRVVRLGRAVRIPCEEVDRLSRDGVNRE